MRALGPAIEDVDLSDTGEADVTVVEVAAVDVHKTCRSVSLTPDEPTGTGTKKF